MAEKAVDVSTETKFGSDQVMQAVDSHAVEYGIPPAIDVRTWFYDKTTRTFGVLPADYRDRFVAVSAVYAASCESENESVPKDQSATLEISAVIKKADPGEAARLALPAGAPGALTRAAFLKIQEGRGKLEVVFRTLFSGLREHQAAWYAANASWTEYAEKAQLTGVDSDKIGAAEIQDITEVYGPSAITYGMAMAQRLIDEPDGSPRTLDAIFAELDADVLVGPGGAPTAFPTLFADLYGPVNDPLSPAILGIPVVAGAPYGMDAVAKARATAGRQLFLYLGGPTATNQERARRGKKLLKPIMGQDPWGAPASPLSYDYNVLEKYRSQGLRKDLEPVYQTYLKLVEQLKEPLPWQILMEGIRRVGYVPNEGTKFDINGSPDWAIKFKDKNNKTKWEFSIIAAIKQAQRSEKIVQAERSIMEGGDKILDVWGAIIGRFRETGGVRSELAKDLTLLSLKMMKKRKQAPPFKLKQFWALHDGLLISEGLDWSGIKDYYQIDAAIDEAIKASGNELTFMGDLAQTVLDIAGVKKRK